MNVVPVKPIPGHDRYFVSTLGHIIGPNGLMKPFSDKDGYLRFAMYIGPKRYKKAIVHRVVYAAFVGDLDDDLVVCHKDGSRTNNDFRNLEQKTQLLNIHDKHKHGTWQVGDKAPNVKYAESLVSAIANDIRSTPKYHGKLVDIAKKHNVPAHVVYAVGLKKRSGL